MKQTNDETERASRLSELMNRQMRACPPDRRDRQMHLFLAQAQTPSEKLRGLGILMNFVIACRDKQAGTKHG